MAEITFVTAVGERKTINATEGSLMQAAVQHSIAGIDGDCGGVCSCATCHVHLSPDWFEKLGSPNEIEAGMLEFEHNVTDFSRLSCQIEISEAVDGLIVEVANG